MGVRIWIVTGKRHLLQGDCLVKYVSDSAEGLIWYRRKER